VKISFVVPKPVVLKLGGYRMNILNNERGAVLVFVAMGLVLFVLFLGVALDTGWTVYVRSQGQARVDSAALAGASGLFDQAEGARETAAKQLAETFSDTENPVLTTDTNTTEDVIPMHYNPATQALTEAPGWAPATNGDYVNNVGCNAVQVSNVVPTPLFFSGVRNVFGAGENGSTDINVTATGYLGCPGGALVDGPGYAPIALRACRFSDLNTSCANREVTLWQSPSGAGSTDNSAWTTLLEGGGANTCRNLVNGTETPAQVNTCPNTDSTIQLIGTGQVTSCLCELQSQYSSCTKAVCDAGGSAADACTAIVPVIDTGCTGTYCDGTAPGTNQSSGRVVSWAKLCITAVYKKGGGACGDSAGANPCENDDTGKQATKCVKGQLRCGQSIPGSTTTAGQCFGSSASNPVLVQ
jgi:Flp pilus assembly protein TadG